MDYYYVKNGQKFGPFSLNELQDKKIDSNCMVWNNSMPDWALAEKISELYGHLTYQEPPITQLQTSSVVKIKTPIPKIPNLDPKYDNSYERNYLPTVIGGALLIVYLVIYYRYQTYLKENTFNSFYINKKSESFFSEDERNFLLFIGLFLRIAVPFWIDKLCDELNREKIWVWISILLPIPTLTIIGSLKKKKLVIEIDGNLPPEEQVKILSSKARYFFKKERYEEAILILNTTLKSSQDKDLLKLRANCFLKNKQFERALQDYTELSKVDHYKANAYKNMGLILFELKEYDNAIAAWEVGASLNDAECIINIKRFVTYRGKYLLDKESAKLKIDYTEKDDRNVVYCNISVEGLGIEINKKTSSISIENLGLFLEIHISWKLTEYAAITFFEIDNAMIYENICEFNMKDGQSIRIKNEKTESSNYRIIKEALQKRMLLK